MKRPRTEPASPARTYRGETAEARTDQRRAKLLEAALDCFATRGVASTTMRDICSQARLTDRYFYESFRNTRDAHEAVCAWQKGMLEARASEAMARAPLNLIDQARAGLAAFYAYLREDVRRSHVLLNDGLTGAAHPDDEPPRAALGPCIALIQKAALRADPRIQQNFDVDMVARGLLGMATQVGSVWARSGYAQPLEEVVDHNLYAWRGLERWVQETATGRQQAA